MIENDRISFVVDECNKVAKAPNTNDDSKPLRGQAMDHEFEGFSVWLEPCPVESQNLFEEVQFLASKCGGPKCGCHAFVPHVTLLYNIPTTKLQQHSDGKAEQARDGLNMLKQSLRTFQETLRNTSPDPDSKDTDNSRKNYTAHNDEKDINDGAPSVTNQNDIVTHENGADSSCLGHLTIHPTQFYFFEYPKTADDGRGFGCVISMLLVNKTVALEKLQEAVKQSFPPDERHETGEFIPHVAFVYAPESYGTWLKEHTSQRQQLCDEDEQPNNNMLQPFRARYLSLWSTQGKIYDWYRIAKIELSQAMPLTNGVCRPR